MWQDDIASIRQYATEPIVAIITAQMRSAAQDFEALICKGIKHFYLQVPGASSADELAKMRILAERHSVHVTMGYTKNIAPLVRKGLDTYYAAEEQRRQLQEIKKRGIKHVLLEMPGTPSYASVQKLINSARENSMDNIETWRPNIDDWVGGALAVATKVRHLVLTSGDCETRPTMEEQQLPFDRSSVGGEVDQPIVVDVDRPACITLQHVSDSTPCNSYQDAQQNEGLLHRMTYHELCIANTYWNIADKSATGLVLDYEVDMTRTKFVPNRLRTPYHGDFERVCFCICNDQNEKMWIDTASSSNAGNVDGDAPTQDNASDSLQCMGSRSTCTVDAPLFQPKHQPKLVFTLPAMRDADKMLRVFQPVDDLPWWEVLDDEEKKYVPPDECSANKICNASNRYIFHNSELHVHLIRSVARSVAQSCNAQGQIDAISRTLESIRLRSWQWRLRPLELKRKSDGTTTHTSTEDKAIKDAIKKCASKIGWEDFGCLASMRIDDAYGKDAASNSFSSSRYYAKSSRSCRDAEQFQSGHSAGQLASCCDDNRCDCKHDARRILV
eukprot:SAG31_NODE_547_length_14228_cov_3.787105_15_plen_557_part_00